jgi:hypothetical protein
MVVLSEGMEDYELPLIEKWFISNTFKNSLIKHDLGVGIG